LINGSGVDKMIGPSLRRRPKRTVFASNVSFEEGEQIARINGYTPTGRAKNKKGQFVVFAAVSRLGMI